jgi:hypothetical protein
LPHAAGNSVALWLPELLSLVARAIGGHERARSDPTLAGGYEALRVLCVENPEWVQYVAPSALGYVVSHPRFNIYKGRMAEWRLFGFGLDAIPHSMTAYALTLLLQDGTRALSQALPPESSLAPIARRLAQRPALVSGLVLALLSAIWEGGEYLMRRDELRRAGGDASAINMEWSLKDTLFDLLSNAIGWGMASWRRSNGRG